jgi:hypothetical protein
MERTPINNLDKMHHIVLFSFMSFTRISHSKDFNGAMKYADSVFPKLSH